MSGYNLTHLKQLEAESIFIIREVAAEFELAEQRDFGLGGSMRERQRGVEDFGLGAIVRG